MWDLMSPKARPDSFWAIVMSFQNDGAELIGKPSRVSCSINVALVAPPPTGINSPALATKWSQIFRALPHCRVIAVP